MICITKYIGFFLLLLQLTSALHYYSKNDGTRCFFEELSRGTIVLSKLSSGVEQPDGNFLPSADLGLQVTVDETFDGDHRVAVQTITAVSDFTFSAMDSGEHKFCITPKYPDKNAKIRISYNTVLASSEVIDSQRKEEVSSVQRRIHDMNGKLEEIRREQQHIRERESLFRNQSEETNTKVLRWSIIQVIVLVITGAYQLYHLKGFFIKQKVF